MGPALPLGREQPDAREWASGRPGRQAQSLLCLRVTLGGTAAALGQHHGHSGGHGGPGRASAPRPGIWPGPQVLQRLPRHTSAVLSCLPSAQADHTRWARLAVLDVGLGWGVCESTGLERL